MTITINAVDVTDKIIATSFRIDNILTQQVDRCTFTIRNKYGETITKPSVGSEVIVTDGADRLFGGVIVRRTDVSDTYGLVDYDIECSDYTRILNQKLVAETYVNMTVEEIISDFVVNWVVGTTFTMNQVECNITINQIQFNYEPVSECIKRLAEIVGYEWYVDYFKDIYFKEPAAETAPFEVDDSNGTYIDGSLTIRRDNSQLRTSIIVRGGEYKGIEFTASLRLDGKQTTVNLPYKYSDFDATLTGRPLSLGIDGIDDADDFDALYNFQEKTLKFKDSDRPSQNATLSFSGKPHRPVILKYSDPIAVAAVLAAEGFGDGKYEYVVIDKSINSLVAARERAAAEIRTYGETLSEGEFETITAGLKAGMQIRVNVPARSLDEYFIVNKVTTVMKGGTSPYYKVSLITTKTMDYISILKKLLLKDNKALETEEGVQIDLAESILETITLTENVTVQAVNYATEWVLGPMTPTGTQRVFVVEGGRLAA